MTRPVVYVTQPVHEDALALLRGEADVVVGYGDDGVRFDAVLDRVEAYLVRFAGIDARAVTDAPNLRAIARAGAGYESVPVDAARERGVPVFVPSGVNAQSVAEHAFALVLAVARDLTYWESAARSGRDDLLTLREAELGTELAGKRLGLVGAGAIGERVARIGREGFGMSVAAYHPRRTSAQLRDLGMEPEPSLQDLLASCDVVTVHVPLTDETRGMIGGEELAHMRQRSILVNVARGGIVDEGALATAVAAGRPGGAGVDVWRTKVPTADNPLLGVRHVVVSPHRAGRTDEAQRRAGLQAVRALLDALNDRPVRDVTDVTR